MEAFELCCEAILQKNASSNNLIILLPGSFCGAMLSGQSLRVGARPVTDQNSIDSCIIYRIEHHLTLLLVLLLLMAEILHHLGCMKPYK